MFQLFRPLLIAIAALALIECVATCASKPPPPELTVATATAASKPTSSADAGAAASTGATSGTGTASGTGIGGGGSPVPTLSGQTSQERQAVLDKRLNDSLGAFDAKLRGEQQKLAQERDARQATVATVSAADNNSEISDSHRKGQTRSAAYAGDLKSDKSGAGAAATSGNGAVANEIPDGSDDDIIARRLRKAAEQETDPELKDKLWKEYVEYKKNTPGQ